MNDLIKELENMTDNYNNAKKDISLLKDLFDDEYNLIEKDINVIQNKLLDVLASQGLRDSNGIICP